MIKAQQHLYQGIKVLPRPSQNPDLSLTLMLFTLTSMNSRNAVKKRATKSLRSDMTE